MKCPRVRIENIVAQHLDNEILIYDLNTNKAFCLNETSAIVYQACNGKTTFAKLKADHSLSDEMIFLALDELKRHNLLAAADYKSPFAGMTRREAVRRAGMASMIALPMVTSIVAPSAILAQSGCLAPGTLSMTFCSSSGPDCNLNVGMACCSGMATSVSQPCPFVPTSNMACACT